MRRRSTPLAALPYGRNPSRQNDKTVHGATSSGRNFPNVRFISPRWHWRNRPRASGNPRPNGFSASTSWTEPRMTTSSHRSETGARDGDTAATTRGGDVSVVSPFDYLVGVQRRSSRSSRWTCRCAISTTGTRSRKHGGGTAVSAGTARSPARPLPRSRAGGRQVRARPREPRDVVGADPPYISASGVRLPVTSLSPLRFSFPWSISSARRTSPVIDPLSLARTYRLLRRRPRSA